MPSTLFPQPILVAFFFFTVFILNPLSPFVTKLFKIMLDAKSNLALLFQSLQCFIYLESEILIKNISLRYCQAGRLVPQCLHLVSTRLNMLNLTYVVGGNSRETAISLTETLRTPTHRNNYEIIILDTTMA